MVWSVYSTGRAYVPSPLSGGVKSLEAKVAELGMPLLTAVQDQSERVGLIILFLHSADIFVRTVNRVCCCTFNTGGLAHRVVRQKIPTRK